ncbi:unnamed protein product, partial [Lepidochelys olivacea]
SALQCEVCASREQSCSGPLQPCAPSEGTCVTVVAEMRLGGITVTKIVAGCGSPGTCVKRVGVKKYAQGVVEVLSQADCYPAPRAGGGIREP